MAFFFLYVWHGLPVYAIVRRLTGFRWSEANRRTGVFFLPLIAVVFGAFAFLPAWVATAAGSCSAALRALSALRRVMTRPKALPARQWQP